MIIHLFFLNHRNHLLASTKSLQLFWKATENLNSVIPDCNLHMILIGLAVLSCFNLLTSDHSVLKKTTLVALSTSSI